MFSPTKDVYTMVELVGGVSVINGACPTEFLGCFTVVFVEFF